MFAVVKRNGLCRVAPPRSVQEPRRCKLYKGPFQLFLHIADFGTRGINGFTKDPTAHCYHGFKYKVVVLCLDQIQRCGVNAAFPLFPLFVLQRFLSPLPHPLKETPQPSLVKKLETSPTFSHRSLCPAAAASLVFESSNTNSVNHKNLTSHNRSCYVNQVSPPPTLINLILL